MAKISRHTPASCKPEWINIELKRRNWVTNAKLISWITNLIIWSIRLQLAFSFVKYVSYLLWRAHGDQICPNRIWFQNVISLKGCYCDSDDEKCRMIHPHLPDQLPPEHSCYFQGIGSHLAACSHPRKYKCPASDTSPAGDDQVKGTMVRLPDRRIQDHHLLMILETLGWDLWVGSATERDILTLVCNWRNNFQKVKLS